MPITFTVIAGGTPVVFSTDLCGTCASFWHRSFLAGGCSEHHKTGEISINTKKCDNWKLKESYRQEVESEINKVKLHDEVPRT